MKHTLKIILPIILILAIVIGACWFFLIARRDVTESIFVYWGEHFYEAGRYSRAVAFYKAAMRFAPKDAELAIRLADAYKQSGNYTKAEYTLVSAITQIPDSVSLYVALSGTYVEQDKLLDAETMLSRITNDAVRTQIDALRPAAPVIEPESGNYSEYIDVTVTGSSGTVYAVCNSDFPASAQDIYTGPISLEAGESKIVALSVAENGLVSDAVYAGYTVGNVVEEVKLADAGMDAYVRELLGKTAGSAIMSDELWAVEELDLPDTVASLDDLSYFTGLRSLSLHHGASLDLSNNTVSDLTALSGLLALRELNLTNNPVTSLNNLKNCTELETLYAGQCAITRIAGLADHAKLKTLVLPGNQITDISALAGCTALETLDLSGNSISDISVVSGFKQLVDLNVSSNQITELPQFDADTPLWHVDISHNQIESLAGLEGNLAVNFIDADYNRIKSISKLESCIMLVRMNLWDNPVNADEVKQLQDIGILINYNPKYVEPETES